MEKSNMKLQTRFAPLAAALLLSACLLLCACGIATSQSLALPQPTLEELMAEVNAAHKAVTRENIDVTPYLRKTPVQTAEESPYFAKTEFEPCNGNAVLTSEKAKADVELLFAAFYDCYTLYDYFGGEKAFGEAEQQILNACDEKKTMTVSELQDIMGESLSFIQDGHFFINDEHTALLQYPFFYRQTVFDKTETGYQTADGRQVSSVEGCDDLDELFKRSMTQDGQLCYYPVLLRTRNDATVRTDADGTTIYELDETLKIYYADGSAEELTAELYRTFQSDESTECRMDGDIPVFQFDSFPGEKADEFLAGADFLKDAPIAAVDLRANKGGYTTFLPEWFQRYCGKIIGQNPNGTRIDAYTGEIENSNQMSWISRHDEILIVLTSKNTASSAEGFLDAAMKLNNTLCIGENTLGCQMGGINQMQLPNSKICIGMSAGGWIMVEPAGYYEECRGYLPDIWVPAAEAEELAVKLMKNLT